MRPGRLAAASSGDSGSPRPERPSARCSRPPPGAGRREPAPQASARRAAPAAEPDCTAAPLQLALNPTKQPPSLESGATV